MGRLFPWVHPAAGTPEDARLWLHRSAWMNAPLFLARAALYFAVWIATSHLLHRWSVRQDGEGGTALTRRQRWLGAGGLPLLALTMTFAAFDWLMSLEAHLASTIFGVYWFAGSFVSAIAVLILATAAAQRRGLVAEGIGPQHFHSLGKYLLAFVVFWAYIAFSQWMLTWIANLPDEVPWYQARTGGAWAPVGLSLFAFQFALPFFVLLSRELKRRPLALSAVAAWVLAWHYVDLYWVVMPRLDRAAPSPHWTDLTALVGIGAAALAFTVWRLRGAPAVPVGDPYLQDSLRYQPR
jgi:hypothetical protein